MDNFAANDATPAGVGDRRHGQAALLLVETLMHALLEKNILSKRDFVDIVDGAAEVEDDLTTHKVSSDSEAAGSILAPLANYFRKELDG